MSIKKISSKIIFPVKVMVFIVLFGMVSLVAIQIFCRFVLNVSVPWTEEMARLLFIWMIFLGSAIVECEGGQTRTTIFIKDLNPKVRFVLETIIYLLEIIFNVCFFIGTVQSWDTVKMLKFSTVPSLNHRLMFIPVLIGLVFMILFLVFQEISAYRIYILGKEE